MAATALAAVPGRHNGLAETPFLLHVANNGASPPATLWPAGIFSLSLPRSNLNRTFLIQRPGLEVTPSRGYFAKESLDFSKS